MKKNLIILFILILITGLLLPSCSTRNQLAKNEETAIKERKELAKKKLELLLTKNSMTLEEKEVELNEIKSWNIQDQEIDELIKKVEFNLINERRIVEEEIEKKRLEDEKNENQKKHLNATKEKLTSLFKKIATTKDSVLLAGYFQESIQMFDSEQVPVLIVINDSNGHKDYDRPTTIKRYLEFIKDQNKYSDRFLNILFDGNGKITELELLK